MSGWADHQCAPDQVVVQLVIDGDNPPLNHCDFRAAVHALRDRRLSLTRIAERVRRAPRSVSRIVAERRVA